MKATLSDNGPYGENAAHNESHQVGFVDEADLLRRLPVSRRTLHNWRATGKLPFVRVPGSRRLLYFWPNVEAALLRLQRGPTQ